MATPRLWQYESFLHARGMKLTRERRLVAEVVFARPGPYWVETMVDEVCNELFTQSVSRSTVYRTFKELEHLGFISFQRDQDHKES